MSEELLIPMSPLQCAYMIEREGGHGTLGVPCHVYMEFVTFSINESCLRKAWASLFLRHPMMRAKAEICGLLNITGIDEWMGEETVRVWEEEAFIKENMRETLSHEKLDVQNGTNCRLHIIKQQNQIVRLAFDLDLTMCDVLSFLIILRDLGDSYMQFMTGKVKEFRPDPLEENSIRKSENKDTAYWKKRLSGCDISFPVRKIGEIKDLKEYRYIGINRQIDKTVLDKLMIKFDVSAEEILLIVFAYTFLKYTKKKQLLVNFPFSSRKEKNRNSVGDFTKSIVYRCQMEKEVSFTVFFESAHKKYYEDRKHNNLDGLSIQRIIKNQCSIKEKYPVPLVFSPSMDIPLLSENFLEQIGNLSYIISQTPGVWLDAQVYRLKNKILFTWVVLEKFLDEQEVSRIMDLYIKILNELVEGVDEDEKKGY